MSSGPRVTQGLQDYCQVVRLTTNGKVCEGRKCTQESNPAVHGLGEGINVWYWESITIAMADPGNGQGRNVGGSSEELDSIFDVGRVVVRIDVIVGTPFRALG